MIEVWSWPTPNGHKVHIALEELGLCDRVGYLSTGGGASLSFIEREGHLPGIDALRQAPNAPKG